MTEYGIYKLKIDEKENFMVLERLITELSELVMQKAKENYSNLMTKRFCYFGDLYEADNAAFTKMMEARGQKGISSHFTRSQLSMTAALLFMEEIKAVTEMRLPLYSGEFDFKCTLQLFTDEGSILALFRGNADYKQIVEAAGWLQDYEYSDFIDESRGMVANLISMNQLANTRAVSSAIPGIEERAEAVADHLLNYADTDSIGTEELEKLRKEKVREIMPRLSSEPVILP